MVLYIKNMEFETVGVIDTAESVIWRETYVGCGDFELYLVADNTYMEMLKDHFYVMRDDSKAWMIIESRQIITDIEGGNYLIVKGRSLESIIGRRIVWSQTNLYGRVHEVIKRLLTENIVNPKQPPRKINNFVISGTASAYNATIGMPLVDKQISYKGLQDTIDELCIQYGIGYCIEVVNRDEFWFSLYAGEDRSYNQTRNPYVVFSPDFENLISSEYLYDKTNYKNSILVGGEGEGTARKTVSAGPKPDVWPSGLYRYEMFADARNASTNNGAISNAKYIEMLRKDGYEELAERQPNEMFSGKVDYQTPYTYGVDYELGDIVQVENEYGISATARITEVIESENETGYNIIPTFFI